MDNFTFIKQILSEYNQKALTITENTTFSELQMDSYDLVDFLMKIEGAFNIVISDEEMLEKRSVLDVMNTIQSMQEDK